MSDAQRGRSGGKAVAGEVKENRRGKGHRIQPVQHAAVAGQALPPVFDAQRAFHRGQHQPAKKAGAHHGRRQQGRLPGRERGKAIQGRARRAGQAAAAQQATTAKLAKNHTPRNLPLR